MRALLFTSVVLSCCYLSLILTGNATGSVLSIFLKVASVGLLLVAVASARPLKVLLLAALASSVTGDFLLEVTHLGSMTAAQLFLFGLIAFLLAHVCYLALFVKEKSPIPVSLFRKTAGPIVVFVVFSTLVGLWHGLAELRIPVLVYSIALGAMTMAALRSRFPSSVAVGALLFLASDTMLALDIFGHPFTGARTLVWITYYCAQLLITHGITSSHMTASATA